MGHSKSISFSVVICAATAALLVVMPLGCSDNSTAPSNPPDLVVSEDVIVVSSPNASEDFTVWNGGHGTLEWEAVSTQNWCDIAPGIGVSTGPKDPTTITAKIDYSGFNLGETRLADINITSDGGDRTVNVRATLPAGPCDVRVTRPKFDDVWPAGISEVIRWTSQNTGGFVRIELYKGGVHQCQIAPMAQDMGLYEWVVDDCGAGPASDYRVQIYDVGNAACFAASDEFEITDSQPDPFVAVSTKSLAFNADLDPGPKTFEVWNSGTGTLDWTVSVPVIYDWLQALPESGTSTGEHHQITVTVDWTTFVTPGEVRDGVIEIGSNAGGAVISVKAIKP
ncbi:MAG: Ser-Thr-rich GPI-anchored membrane family protein [bacterium]